MNKKALSSQIKSELGEEHPLYEKAVKLESLLDAATEKIERVRRACANNGHVQRILK